MAAETPILTFPAADQMGAAMYEFAPALALDAGEFETESLFAGQIAGDRLVQLAQSDPGVVHKGTGANVDVVYLALGSYEMLHTSRRQNRLEDWDKHSFVFGYLFQMAVSLEGTDFPREEIPQTMRKYLQGEK